jgi:hypothetical protein
MSYHWHEKFPLKHLWLFVISYHWHEKFPLKHLWLFVISYHWHENFPLKHLWLFVTSYHWHEKFSLKHLWLFITSYHWHERFPLKHLWLFIMRYHWHEKFRLKHLWLSIVSNHWHEFHTVAVDCRLYTEQNYFRSRSIQARILQGSTRLLLSPLLTHHGRPKTMQWLPITLLPGLQITYCILQSPLSIFLQYAQGVTLVHNIHLWQFNSL